MADKTSTELMGEARARSDMQAWMAHRYRDLPEDIKEMMGKPTGSFAPAQTSPLGTEGYWIPYSNGQMCFSQKYGAHPVWGGINRLHHDMGGTGSGLGYPIAGEVSAKRPPNGEHRAYQQFENGIIVWQEGLGTIAFVKEKAY